MPRTSVNLCSGRIPKDPGPVSGLGCGWGDPNADFIVPCGPFRNSHLSHPLPHTVRRNFTLFSFNAAFSLLHGSLEEERLMILGICNCGNLRNLG